ncbi:ABC transporter substrate-binding protein [Paenibacillus sp. GCM10027626]|uniref:ABC transporter substrate-binding protein n=1 Tax=Paenibacillus sp. GCM10027626 TaxID=3273411 RepID=UPI003638DDB0
MGKRFQRLVSVTSLVMLTAMVSACSTEKSTTNSPAETEPVEIKFLTSWVGNHPFAGYLNEKIEKFNKQHENQIVVKVEDVPDDAAMNEKLKVMISGRDFPDIAVTDSGSIADLAAKGGVVLDLKPYIDADPDWKSSLDERGLETWNHNTGKWHAITSHNDVVGYFYNKQLFNEAGIQAPATTWEEFFKQCEMLKEKGITPIAINTAQNGWTANLWFISLIGTNGDAGNKLANTNHPETYETPEVISAANNLKKIMTQYSTKDAVGLDYAGAMNYFLQGKAAMIANGIWLTADVYDKQKSIKGLKDNLGVAKYPGDGIVSTPGFTFMASNLDERKYDAEVKFIRFLTDEQGQIDKLTQLNLVPASSKIDVSQYQIDPMLKELINQAKSAKYTYVTPWAIYQESVTSNITQDLASLAFKQTPEQFAKTLTSQIKN